MIDFSAPLARINAAESSLNQTAAKVAQYGFAGGSDSVDLSSGMVALLQARSSVASNVNVAHAEDQMMQSLLNIVA
jgi:flagellar basal body rod protein FlgG